MKPQSASIVLLGLLCGGALSASILIVPPVRALDNNSGTCCPETGSICIVGGIEKQNYYYKAEGPCRGSGN